MRKKKKKKFPQKVFRPKWLSHLVFTETPEMTGDTPKFYLRWNERLPRTGLHTGTRYSTHSSRNGIKSITLVTLQQTFTIISQLQYFKNGNNRKRNNTRKYIYIEKTKKKMTGEE
jgi:hypothetical protein